MERYYDKPNRRLIYVRQEATPAMWDKHWSLDQESARKALRSPPSRWLVRYTGRFLKPHDGPILEGGCGTGQHVAALHRSGYSVIGIDFAPTTVDMVKRVAPELDIRLGDVRKLPIESASLAGYWSLGVIEHFWMGYGPIATEMARVVRPGGYLFLTFPHMSFVRRVKARIGSYRFFVEQDAPANFYQFALDARAVAADFTKFGFELVNRKGLAGLKGIKDEFALIHSPLQALYDFHGSAFIIRGIRWLFDRLMAPFAGHTTLLVFRRSEPSDVNSATR